MSIGMANPRIHHEGLSLRRTLASVLAASFALVIVGAPCVAQEKDRKITDENITKAAVARMNRAGGMDAAKIQASTSEGVVTLYGTAPTFEAKERAEFISQGIRGVKSVENRIKVQPVERTDAQIRDDVMAALAANAVMSEAARGIHAQVKDGVVTLTGDVSSWQASEMAARCAEDVRGVRELRNDCKVALKAKPTDEEIAGQIQRRIGNDAGLWGSHVRADVRDGAVTLSGDVGSAAARARAIRDAHVDGMRSINAQGLIVRWRPTERSARQETPPVERTAVQTRDAVRDSLRYEPWLLGSHIEVAAQDSEVTLTGTVGTLRAKHAAERAARDVLGVHQVRNELQVKPMSEPATKQIPEAVAAAIGRDAYLADDKVTATYTESTGTIKLQGDVDSRYEATRAEQIAAGMSGVKAIDDELKVAGRTVEHAKSWLPGYYHPFARVYPALGDRAQYKDDADLKSSIESEFFWSPYVDQDQVQVAVKDGVATLSGTVTDWGEHGAAIENAYEAGAKTVKDDLKVKHGPAVRRP